MYYKFSLLIKNVNLQLFRCLQNLLHQRIEKKQPTFIITKCMLFPAEYITEKIFEKIKT